MSYHRRYNLKDDRFGLLAQMLREQAGLRQIDVATAQGISERAIQYWKAGTASPAAAHLKKLTKIYLRHGALSKRPSL